MMTYHSKKGKIVIKKGVIFTDNSGNERFEVRRVFKKKDVVLLYSMKSGVVFKMSLATLKKYLDRRENA